MRSGPRLNFHPAASPARRLRPRRAPDRHHGKGRHRRPARRHQASRSPKKERLDARVRRLDEVASTELNLNLNLNLTSSRRAVSSLPTGCVPLQPCGTQKNAEGYPAAQFDAGNMHPPLPSFLLLLLTFSFGHPTTSVPTETNLSFLPLSLFPRLRFA